MKQRSDVLFLAFPEKSERARTRLNYSVFDVFERLSFGRHICFVMADPKSKAPPTTGKPASPASSGGAPAKVARVAKAKKNAEGGKQERKKKRIRVRNWDLGNGIYRYSRSKMFHRKASYKFVGRKTPKKVRPKKPRTLVKKIGGEKNGGTRRVLLKKRPNSFPTSDPIKKRRSRQLFSKHRRYIRRSLQPGTICILVAGPHKGKRVVLLKSLKTGLLLITGPFKLNGCPLRRVSQNYVIATSTRLDMADVKIPTHIKDEYFKRLRPKKVKKEEGDIFSSKKEKYKLTQQRKEDQKAIDKMILGAIRKSADRKYLCAYLTSMFGLRSSQYPHRMKF